jgi:O-antigen/teichoic acid export membrane protein
MAEEASPSTPLRVSTVVADLGRLAGMQIVLALAGLARYKILAVRLGPDGLGAFQQLVIATGTITVLVSFGLAAGLSRNIAAAPDHQARQAYLKSAVGIVWALSIVSWGILATTLLVNPGAIAELGVPVTRNVGWAALFLAVSIPLEATKNVLVGFLTGAHEIRGLAKGRSIAVLIATVGSLPLLWFFDLAGAALQLTSITLLVVLVLGRACRKAGYAPFSVRFNRVTVATLAAFGAASLASTFADHFGTLLVRTQLVHQYGLAENGYFLAALVLARQVQTVVLGSVGSQAVARLSVDAGPANVKATAGALLRGIMPIAVLALGAVGLLAVPLLIVLYARSFVVAATFLPLLLGGVLLETFGRIISAPIVAVRRLRLWLALDIVHYAARTIASLVLLPIIGAKAVAAGLFIGICVYVATNMYVYFRVLKFELDPVLVRDLGVGLAVVLMTAWLGAASPVTWQYYLLGGTLWAGSLAVLGHRHIGRERVRTLLHRFRTEGVP